jgi:predicted aldo/keto reductase-like oxidoreductase
MEAWDLEGYARARYGLMGQGGHWFPGRNADLLDHQVSEAELRAALAGSPWVDHIPGILRSLRDRLGGQPVNRLMAS